jgi:hypothetical protein
MEPKFELDPKLNVRALALMADFEIALASARRKFDRQPRAWKENADDPIGWMEDMEHAIDGLDRVTYAYEDA